MGPLKCWQRPTGHGANWLQPAAAAIAAVGAKGPAVGAKGPAGVDKHHPQVQLPTRASMLPALHKEMNQGGDANNRHLKVQVTPADA